MRANYTRIIIGMEFELSPRMAGGGTVYRTGHGWRLGLPAGPARAYRLAQLDDYARTPRSRLKHSPPWTFSLRARTSNTDLPGTWGLGLWNDPFGFSLGFGGGKPGRLPTLPQTTWFFHASPPNWLSLRNGPESVPNGFFAGSFRSLPIPSPLLAPGLLFLPFSTIRPISRLLRKLASQIIHQAAVQIDLDVTQWHVYSIQWLHESCIFLMDGDEILRTSLFPRAPLGLVLWIDNQYAAWTPKGNMRYGTLENPACWLEIEEM